MFIEQRLEASSEFTPALEADAHDLQVGAGVLAHPARPTHVGVQQRM